jgi:hypothetical protein
VARIDRAADGGKFAQPGKVFEKSPHRRLLFGAISARKRASAWASDIEGMK